MQLYCRTIPTFFFLIYLCCFSNPFTLVKQEHSQQQPLLNWKNDPNESMIIGVRGHWLLRQKHIAIQNPSGDLKWSWYLNVDHEKDIHPKVKDCIHLGDSITEIKRAASGSKIVAIVGSAVIVFDTPSLSHTFLPRIRFAICVKQSHTVELLPNDFLAVATSGQTQSDGIHVYDLRTSAPAADRPEPPPAQVIEGFPAVHGLLWDEKARILWAIGNDKAPEVDEPSQGLLRSFSFDLNSDRKTILRPSEHDDIPIGKPTRLTIEWGSNTRWWNGPHDIAVIPNTRKVLVTSDLEVHGIDLESRSFLDESEVNTILKGFESNGKRHGLTRSDIKALSINGQGQVIYVQADWGYWSTKAVRVIKGAGKVTQVDVGDVYKARWFTEIPGWPAA
ncbi:WD40 YVTN repeat-like-containing protein [Fusarium heterosporum]|uniref:WD40 YVTN repeat-like-containing protein n=1 Tax=Fusarium heterosporum TaxID=42747 RepID=A0A8H5TPS8_FUSHE|nr:WD40 YVTN repeat-like-containing protein [Fusarium heterosporum]